MNVYTPYTSTTLTTKSYYSGPFVIPAEYLDNAKLTAILARATAITGARVDKAAAEFTAPVYDKVTYWPKATLDSQNGDIAKGFYTNAKIPESVYSYNWKAPSELNPCDDIFVMPHADPTWATIRCRPPAYSAICTAVAPDPVRTRRMNATRRP